MDETRFDGWTRRRFGLAAGGMTAALLGLAGVMESDAKKKHKKKRCRKLGAICVQGAKRKCCGELRCEPRPEALIGEFVCCKTEGKTCQGPFDCCPDLGCAEGVCKPVKM